MAGSIGRFNWQVQLAGSTGSQNLRSEPLSPWVVDSLSHTTFLNYKSFNGLMAILQKRFKPLSWTGHNRIYPCLIPSGHLLSGIQKRSGRPDFLMYAAPRRFLSHFGLGCAMSRWLTEAGLFRADRAVSSLFRDNSGNVNINLIKWCNTGLRQ